MDDDEARRVLGVYPTSSEADVAAAAHRKLEQLTLYTLPNTPLELRRSAEAEIRRVRAAEAQLRRDARRQGRGIPWEVDDTLQVAFVVIGAGLGAWGGWAGTDREAVAGGWLVFWVAVGAVLGGVAGSWVWKVINAYW